MSLSIFESRNLPANGDDPDTAEYLGELRETNLRLRLLVCELIAKNQQLRFERAKEQESFSADTDECASGTYHRNLWETKRAKVDCKLSEIDQVLQEVTVAGCP
jgi:hypothetical protein